MESEILKVDDLSYSYHTLTGETAALSHISFSVRGISRRRRSLRLRQIHGSVTDCRTFDAVLRRDHFLWKKRA